MAPSALTIFVGDPTLVKATRKQFITKYGQVNEKWPTMADHSKMRFIPIIKGYINDDEAREQLYEQLKHQATSKASAVKLNFPFQDITNKKTYFGEKSLEQIIHGMTTKEDKDIPLFKHITTKWSQNDTKQQYEIVVASSLVDEATRELRGLKNYLIKEYGNEARKHFAGVKNIATKTVIVRKRNYTLFNTDWDEDISNFIKQTNNKDKLSKEQSYNPANATYIF